MSKIVMPHVQHTFNLVHNAVSWWQPGFYVVICIPAVAWIIGYLFIEFDWFDFDACMQTGRMIAFYTLPTVYALWFALPYAGVEIILLAALVIRLAFLFVREYKKFASKRRHHANPDTPREILDVIPGGRQRC